MKKLMVLIFALILIACGDGKKNIMFTTDVISQMEVSDSTIVHDRDGIIHGIISGGMRSKQFNGDLLNYMHENIVLVQGPKQIDRVHKTVAYDILNNMLDMYPPYEENGQPLFDLFVGEQNGFLIYQVEYPYQEGIQSDGQPQLTLASIKFLIDGDEIVALR